MNQVQLQALVVGKIHDCVRWYRNDEITYNWLVSLPTKIFTNDSSIESRTCRTTNHSKHASSWPLRREIARGAVAPELIYYQLYIPSLWNYDGCHWATMVRDRYWITSHGSERRSMIVSVLLPCHCWEPGPAWMPAFDLRRIAQSCAKYEDRSNKKRGGSTPFFLPLSGHSRPACVKHQNHITDKRDRYTEIQSVYQINRQDDTTEKTHSSAAWPVEVGPFSKRWTLWWSKFGSRRCDTLIFRLWTSNCRRRAYRWWGKLAGKRTNGVLSLGGSKVEDWKRVADRRLAVAPSVSALFCSRLGNASAKGCAHQWL